jgi:hypothetical protein
MVVFPSSGRRAAGRCNVVSHFERASLKLVIAFGVFSFGYANFGFGFWCVAFCQLHDSAGI